MTKHLIFISIGAAALFSAAAAVAEDTVFKSGLPSKAESFGPTERIVLFAAAVLGIAAVYTMMLLSRRVHRRAKKELSETARLLEEKQP